MLIDWFTVAAQMMNFLILVWLLRRFLYGPLLKTMDERQQQINKHLAEIELDRQTAEATRVKLAAEVTAFERAREERLRVISQESEERRKHLTEELRLEIDTLRSRWKGALTQEQESFRRNLSSLAQQELVELAGKITSDLADAQLEGLMVSRFIQRLREEAATSPSEGIFAALKRSPVPGVTVRSSLPLPAETATLIKTELAKHLGGEGQIEFLVAPEIGCGIELSVDHHKLSWTIAEYVASFRDSLEAAVQQKTDATT